MTALVATTPVPSPMAVDGVVSSIIPERVLVVRISDLASGRERLTWRTAWRALKSAEEAGWRTAHPAEVGKESCRTLPGVQGVQLE
jgi:hypothetical protein